MAVKRNINSFDGWHSLVGAGMPFAPPAGVEGINLQPVDMGYTWSLVHAQDTSSSEILRNRDRNNRHRSWPAWHCARVATFAFDLR
jgi:hypothetical protein